MKEKQEFIIAASTELGEHRVVNEKHNVTEELFWAILRNTAREATHKEPNKFQSTLELVSQHLKGGIGLHFQNIWFLIKTIKTK